MANYVIVLLLPALLTSADIGFAQPAASRALAMSNYGGVAGALLGAIVLQRLGLANRDAGDGSRWRGGAEEYSPVGP